MSLLSALLAQPTLVTIASVASTTATSFAAFTDSAASRASTEPPQGLLWGNGVGPMTYCLIQKTILKQPAISPHPLPQMIKDLFLMLLIGLRKLLIFQFFALSPQISRPTTFSTKANQFYNHYCYGSVVIRFLSSCHQSCSPLVLISN